MKRKFKFLGTTELNDKGEQVSSGMNFGRHGWLLKDQVIEVTDAEALNVADHDKFEEVVSKPSKPA